MMRLGSRFALACSTTLAFALPWGCGGGDTTPTGAGGAGASGASSAQSSSAGGGCAVAGCAPTPICPEACSNPCGCCSCTPGMMELMGGAFFVCQGDCWALSDAGTCSIPECFKTIDCVETCGGPIVYSSCCSCPANLVETTQCADAGSDGG